MAKKTTKRKSKTKNRNFKKFGHNFQLATLSLLIQDRVFAHQTMSIISAEYFDTKYMQWIFGKISDHMVKYQAPPTFDTLKGQIKSEIDENMQDAYFSVLQGIQEADLSDGKYIKDEVFSFSSTRFALNKAEEMVNHIEMGNLEKARSVMYEAFKPLDTTTKIYDLKEDYNEVFDEELASPIPTPLDPFNKVTKGGPSRGDLAIAVGPSNFGKTAFLTATARHAANEGYKVAYFSLETRATQIFKRALAGLLEVPQDFLGDHTGLIERKLEAMSGNVQLMQLRATTASIARISWGIEEMKANGFFPDMLIIDGLNQLKLDKEKRRYNADNNSKFESLSEELRDMAGELDVVVHTVFQTNRIGFNTEVNDEQSIGKAIEPFQVADWVIIFSQTVEQAEKEPPQCRVRLLKNRWGPKGLTLLLNFDADQAKFVVCQKEKLSSLYDTEKREAENQGVKAVKDLLRERQNNQQKN